eukprot:m.140330 g.140330  ORF g.140330 m.140330 type:complete len:73 (-) comp24105_c1_seq2:208-426(-)
MTSFYEMQNLADQNPDVVQSMKADLLKWFGTLNVTAVPVAKKNGCADYKFPGRPVPKNEFLGYDEEMQPIRG